jgi:lipopolysaccharide transport system permease protein
MKPPLLWYFVKRDLQERYSGSVLGTIWLFASPLAQILIFTLVFGNILGPRLAAGQGAYAYGIYLVSGVLPWTAFATTIGRTSTAFIDKAGTITKIAVGLGTVAVQFALAESIVLVATLLLFLAVMVLLGSPPTAMALYLPLLIVFQQLIAFCIGLAGAMLTVFLRDIKEVVGLVVMVWFWLTPVVYIVTDVNPVLRAAESFNPAFWFIDQYHRVLVSGQPPDFQAMAGEGTVVVALIGLLLWTLSRVERDIRDFL